MQTVFAATLKIPMSVLTGKESQHYILAHTLYNVL